jgi:N-acetylmuramoyl-L-alanine amidase
MNCEYPLTKRIMLKKIALLSVSLAFFIALTAYISHPSYKSVAALRKVVIDAGHGGHDGGAPGKYSREKDVSLAVAIKLGQLIMQEIPDVEVVYTRTSDIYQHPTVKANIANQAKGDLFIAIHCNSAPGIKHREFTGYKTETYYSGKGKKKKKKTRKVATYRYWTTPSEAKGTETYIWGAHKNEAKEVAMRENEALYIDSSLAQQVSDFDPNSPEKMILYSLKTKQYFNRSAALAMTVEDEFKKTGRISREARQRQVGIWVLQAVAMPAILVELGFISNPEEEDYLNSDNGQAEMTKAIVEAVKRYKYSLEHQMIEVK